MTAAARVDEAGGRADRLGPWLRGATLVWIVGMSTVFPAGNEALEAVSVFTFDRVAYLVVLALAGLWIASEPGVLRRLGAVEAMMALYAGIALLSWSTTLSAKTGVDLKRDIDLLLTSVAMPLTAFVVARHGGWSRSGATRSLWLVVALMTAFLLAVALVQALYDWRFLVAEAHYQVHRGRTRGAFPNALPYAAVLGVLIPLAVVVSGREANAGRRRAMGIACAGLAEALLLSQLRVAWLAVPVALLWLALVCVPIRRLALIVAAGFSLLVALALVGIDLRLLAGSGGALQQRNASVRERLEDAEPTYNRVAVYATALNMIRHRPWLGYGFGGRTFVRERDPFFTSCCGVSPEWAVTCQVPHNEVLNLLVLMGIAGLAAFVAMIVVLWRRLTAVRRSGLDGPIPLAAAAQAGILVLLVMGQLHDVMYLYTAQTLLFFTAGLAMTSEAGAA